MTSLKKMPPNPPLWQLEFQVEPCACREVSICLRSGAKKKSQRPSNGRARLGDNAGVFFSCLYSWWLVFFSHPILKNIWSSKWDHFSPNNWGWNVLIKKLKPTLQVLVVQLCLGKPGVFSWWSKLYQQLVDKTTAKIRVRVVLFGWWRKGFNIPNKSQNNNKGDFLAGWVVSIYPKQSCYIP